MMVKDDRWIVISGAGGALGGAFAAHYGAQGRRVLALDRRFEATGQFGDSVVTRTTDLVAEESVREAVNSVLAPRDGISLLINAVGQIWNEPILAFRGSKLATHAIETWRNVIEANLTAAFVVATHVAATMARHGGGCIVNFSSIASEGNPGQAAYSAAKAGIEGFTRTMAAELGPVGVRVNAVALGFVDVATTRNAVPAPRLDQYAQRTPLGRLGRVEEVMGAVEFLSANAFVTGTILKVDGGLRL